MSEEEKLLSGKLFNPVDSNLVSLKLKAHRLSMDYNHLYEDETAERERIVHELFAGVGNGTFIQGPITVHYGCHTTIGENTFINFNLTIQDDAIVSIGDHCNFGPNVTIVTPLHPMVPEERKSLKCPDGTNRYLCYAKPVKIGNDVWVGANVVICPGVTISDGCVIGAGSVVTKDIPPRCIAVGNPARILRTIAPEDSLVERHEMF